MGLFSNCSYLLRGAILHHIGWWMGSRPKDGALILNAENYLRAKYGEGSQLEALTQGTNPIVRKIIRSGEPDIVARVYYRGAVREKSREHSQVSALLESVGVPVPKIIELDDGKLTLGRYGFDVVSEEWVAGRHPSPEDYLGPDSPWLCSLMELLAKLHEQKSSHSGKPWSRHKSNQDFIEYYFRSHEDPMIDLIAQCDFIDCGADQLVDLKKLFNDLALADR